MTARSIRRAERKAKKLARKAEGNRVGQVVNLQADYQSVAFSSEEEPGSISEAQLAANRANAHLSTGPKSLDGKATSCVNAVKTGLTGRTVLLHSDDAADYQRHIAAYQKEFVPIGQRECDLVQSIADTAWRLARIPALEFAIFAQGRAQFTEEFKDHDVALQPALIELKTFTTYEKQLRNLHIQESRLSRRREKEIAELHELQEARKTDEKKNVGQALSPVVSRPVGSTVNGFEFANRSFVPCAETEIAAFSDPMSVLRI